MQIFLTFAFVFNLLYDKWNIVCYLDILVQYYFKQLLYFTMILSIQVDETWEICTSVI